MRISDRFELENEVHAGGMSRVYRARDEQHGTMVAIKRPAQDETSQLERFVEEALILQSLDHPAIVRYVAHGGSRHDDAFLATEWLQGETLYERLGRGPLTMAESAAVARRVAEGLGIVHRARVVHRDIKPGNLMLCEGAVGVKILDFGIARREQGSGLSSHVTFSGGTWAYMSPEQAMGAAELGARVDIFSLGCVLYECVTGVAAFPSERSAAMFAKVWKDAPRLDALCSGVPPKLTEFVAKMMAKDPYARPRDGLAAASELASLGKLPDTVATKR